MPLICPVMKKFLPHIFLLLSVSCSKDVHISRTDSESPAGCYMVEDLGGWSKSVFYEDGTAILVNNHKTGEVPETMMMYTEDETAGLIQSYMKFDENAVPEVMTFNECTILIDEYSGGKADVTVTFADTVMVSLNGIDCDIVPEGPKTRSWGENNAVRNGVAISKAVLGALEVGTGSVVIAGSVGGLVGSAGTSTPVSVAGIAWGLANIAGGLLSLSDAAETLFMPAGDSNVVADYIGGAYMDTGLEIIQDGIAGNPGNAFMQQHFPDAAKKFFNAPNVPSSSGSFWAALTLDSIDLLWGDSVSASEAFTRLYNSYRLETGTVESLTENHAVLLGYVYPETVAPQGEKVVNEYGIVLYSEDYKEYQNIVNGDGGLLEFTFTGLEENTTYYYYSYFYDKTNYVFKTGEVRMFITPENHKGPLVKKMSTFGELDDESRHKFVFNFEYDSYGRAISFYESSTGMAECSITYSANTVTQDLNGFITVFFIDENGRISGCNVTEPPTGIEWSVEFLYGQGTTLVRTPDEKICFPMDYDDNGNVVRAGNSEISYYEDENITNLLFLDQCILAGSGLSLHDTPWFSRYAGISSKNYVKSIGNSTVTYDFNDSGYPVKVYMDGTLTMEFEYTE